jgi:hypothetical protein
MELIHPLDMAHLSWVFLLTFSTKSLKFQGLLLKDSWNSCFAFHSVRCRFVQLSTRLGFL